MTSKGICQFEARSCDWTMNDHICWLYMRLIFKNHKQNNEIQGQNLWTAIWKGGCAATWHTNRACLANKVTRNTSCSQEAAKLANEQNPPLCLYYQHNISGTRDENETKKGRNSTNPSTQQALSDAKLRSSIASFTDALYFVPTQHGSSKGVLKHSTFVLRHKNVKLLSLARRRQRKKCVTRPTTKRSGTVLVITPRLVTSDGIEAQKHFYPRKLNPVVHEKQVKHGR